MFGFAALACVIIVEKQQELLKYSYFAADKGFEIVYYWFFYLLSSQIMLTIMYSFIYLLSSQIMLTINGFYTPNMSWVVTAVKNWQTDLAVHINN